MSSRDHSPKLLKKIYLLGKDIPIDKHRTLTESIRVIRGGVSYGFTALHRNSSFEV
jgi:hypothetical protein